jgi:hypothetical protein
MSATQEESKGDDTPSVDIHRCGEISAYVAHFGRPKQREVLERLGYEPEAYASSRAHWLDEIAREMDAGRYALATSLGNAHATKRDELDATQPTLESLGPLRAASPSPVEPATDSTSSDKIAPAEPAPAFPPEVESGPRASSPQAMPTYLSAAAAATVPPLPETPSPDRVLAALGVSVDDTLPIPIKVVSLGLPFAGSLSAEEVTARAAAATPPRAPAENVNVDETVMLPKQTTAVVVGQALRERLAPKAIPILSMDEYAEFRAGLAVFGPDHAPTMARFGVGDKMVAEILRQRFAAAFSRDDRLRERFVARLQECVAALRAGGTP